MAKNLIDFVHGFRHHLFVAGCMAKEKLKMSQSKLNNVYDHHTMRQEFSTRHQVLALAPITGSPFQAKYIGLYVVTEKISDLNYMIATPERQKEFAAPWFNRSFAFQVDSSLVRAGAILPQGDDRMW